MWVDEDVFGSGREFRSLIGNLESLGDRIVVVVVAGNVHEVVTVINDVIVDVVVVVRPTILDKDNGQEEDDQTLVLLWNCSLPNGPLSV